MFRAIWISTGRSARAILIHWALQPVAINEIDNAIARIVLDFEIGVRTGLEFDFMMNLLLNQVDTGCEL
jgi:hypothetical protein